MRKDLCDFIRPKLPSLRPLQIDAEEAVDIYLILFAPHDTADSSTRQHRAEAMQAKYGDAWPRVGNAVREWLHSGLEA